MKRLLIFSLALVLLGAGCFDLGGKKEKTNDGGLWRTTDSGGTWTQMTALPVAKGVGSIATTDVLALEHDPIDSEALYIGTRAHGLFFTYDNAATWQQPRLAALREGAIADIEVDPKNLCTLYVAKGPRLYKSSTCGRTWETDRYVETREKVAITVIEIDWYNPNIVWLGLSNGDVLKSEDGARKWARVMNSRFGVNAILVGNADSRIVVVGTLRGGFFRTTDGGRTWTQIEKELQKMREADTVWSLAQDGKSKVVIAATKYGLLRSFDVGATWEALPMLTSPGQVEVHALAVDPADQKHIYYAAGDTFYATTDGGKNWATKKLPTTRLPERMVMDPKNASGVFVGVAASEKEK